jgi:hypothetical protein
MKDWIVKLDEFLKLGGRKLLDSSGSVSKETADIKALSEYEKFREINANELSDIEKRYLENLKETQRKIEKNPPKRKRP